MKRCLISIMCAVLVAGCAAAPKRHPLPSELLNRASVPGMPKIWHWGDEPPTLPKEWTSATRAEFRERFPEVSGKSHNYLSISGGGANGAFGAGLLVGWTEAGNRPTFTIVTGVSTGALMAPLVFLGPEYDSELQELYTTTSTKDILKRRGLLHSIMGNAATDSAPLAKLIARHVDERLLARIAEEHRKGRRLFVGTTDLDAGRPMIWDLGAIAASGDPNALALVRQILLASASIPAAFPPVLLKVEADGEMYDEMHVDGGVASQVFLYPLAMDWEKVLQKLGVPGKPRVYIIRNAPVDPAYVEVQNKLMSISARSIDSLIRTQGIGDLYQIYLATMRDGLLYHLAFIPESFTEKPQEAFDPVYMGKLFDLGKQLGKSGAPWVNIPPGYHP
jgi:Patatin-like phospholipase